MRVASFAVRLVAALVGFAVVLVLAALWLVGAMLYGIARLVAR